MWILIIIVVAIVVLLIGKHLDGGERQLKSPKEVWNEVQSELNELSKEDNYEILNFAVKGLYYRSEDDQSAARELIVGDELKMVPEPTNPRDPNAIKVLTLSGAHIGYVDGKYSKYVMENMYRLQKFIATKITDDAIPYIYAEAYFRKN